MFSQIAIRSFSIKKGGKISEQLNRHLATHTQTQKQTVSEAFKTHSLAKFSNIDKTRLFPRFLVRGGSVMTGTSGRSRPWGVQEDMPLA